MQTKTLALAAFSMLAGSACGQTFSLDDNPDAPLTSPPFAGLFSAEDPFGLLLPPVFMGRIGPSPSLVGFPGAPGFLDGDLLTVVAAVPLRPVIDVPAPSGAYLNAASADHERYDADRFERVRIRYSVDRATSGLPGSDLEKEFSNNQQAGDIYISERFFPNPGVFVGTLGGGPFAGLLPTAVPGAGSPSILEIDESELRLTAGLGPGGFLPPFEPAPGFRRGSHDNVDAFNILPDRRLDRDGDRSPDLDLYTSIPPASAFVNGYSAADIFVTVAGTPGASPVPWATAPSMGLDMLGFPPNPQLEGLRDDIDALVVWDNGKTDPDGNETRAEPELDYALFSLSPGSASLSAIRSAGIPVDASTIFFTDFSGSFAVYLFGEQVGVLSLSSDGGADDIEANIDALEIAVQEMPACDCRQFKADVNLDGVLDGLDFGAWLGAFNTGRCQADQNMDGAINGLDFGAWLNNFNNAVRCP